MFYIFLAFAYGSARVIVGYHGDSSNWYNFVIYNPIEMKLNVKWSKLQRISENQIQIV